MRNPFLFTLIFSALILLIDFYAYRGVKKLVFNYSQKIKKIVWLLFWIVPFILILGLILFAIFYSYIPPSDFLRYFHFISGAFILFYVPKLLFIIFNLLDDLVRLIKKLFNVKKKLKSESQDSGRKITRAQFLTRTGIILAGIPFLSIGYGIIHGRFDFTIRRLKVNFNNLPKNFHGFRIVQISDYHIGSFLNHIPKIEESIELVNDQKPDLILFSGDFVNNVSSEIDKFLPGLKKLKSKYGMYSILGNHDYGDYVRWNSLEEKNQNLRRLIGIQDELGFKMLLNESENFKIGEESISIVGVENWGLPPFPQHGDLNKALQNVEQNSFKILMSHDPTHWDEEVLNKTNIDLTLSGHTHGAQFGIEIPGWRWSPVSMRYKRWGGLYKEGNQLLNVNTGIGFIGFPGRVGMPPEITVIELHNSTA